MIEVTRFDGSRLIVSCDLIKAIEAAPDAVPERWELLLSSD
jgi:uncharacterized protein YlzI (FlbEa/FlbD family)